MKTIITESQRGLKFKHGKFVKLLMPGKYITFGDTEIEVLDIGYVVDSENANLNTLLANADFAPHVTVAEVADNQFMLHFVDGRFQMIYKAGKYAFFNACGNHTFRYADTSVPEVDPSIPSVVLKKISPTLCQRVEVAEYQKARLYYNKCFVRLLEPGVYFFWNNDIAVSASFVDTRLIKMDINGQELLTQDKVTLRINFVCDYKIDDYVKIATEIDDYEEQLRVAVQLALRDYVGKHKLDEILENKDAISAFVAAQLADKAKALYLTVYSADVKDIILPGEIRDIMNTVLIAEKRAQANVITRREEVASTRSLLNTAKLMEENPTLYRLKELEYIERICENVGTIQVNGSGDLLSQLAAVLRGAPKD